MEEINNKPADAPESAAPASPVVRTPGCTGDCKNCTSYQRNYCAAQIGYNIQNVIAGFMAMLSEIHGSVIRLLDEVAAIKKQAEEPPTVIEAPTPAGQTKKTTKKPAKN